MSQALKVVVVHDYISQRGGAERVVLDLLRAFPGARLVTSCWHPQTSYPEFADFDVETLWLNRVPALRRDPRRALPMLARAFRKHVITDADVVICSSSGWAHRVSTPAPKIVYCHNPARWLYQIDDYLPHVPAPGRALFRFATEPLRRSDRVAAHSVARYLVNSTIVARRVAATYGITPQVVPPARGLDPDGPSTPVPGVGGPGFLLTISRARGYKRTEAICAAVAAMPHERLVVIGGDIPGHMSPRITTLRGPDDAQLRWLYANADALIALGQEDFGLTPVEAQAFGTPSLVLRSGGYLDTTVEPVTGLFVDDLSVPAICDRVAALRRTSFDSELIRQHGERFSKQRFSSQLRQVVDEVVLAGREGAGQ